MTSLEAAQEWCDAVLTGRAECAWHMTELAYRRVIVERRVTDDPDDPATVEAVRTFTEKGRDEAAWRACAEAWRLVCELELPAEWRVANAYGEGRLPDEWRAFAREHGLPEEGRLWGWIERPRKVAGDCELVQLVDATDIAPEDVDRAAPFQASETVVLAGGLDFYMLRTGQGEWLLAGLNEFPPDWLELDPE